MTGTKYLNILVIKYYQYHRYCRSFQYYLYLYKFILQMYLIIAQLINFICIGIFCGKYCTLSYFIKFFISYEITIYILYNIGINGAIQQSGSCILSLESFNMSSLISNRNFANSVSSGRTRMFSVKKKFVKCFQVELNLIERFTISLRVLCIGPMHKFVPKFREILFAADFFRSHMY